MNSTLSTAPNKLYESLYEGKKKFKTPNVSPVCVGWECEASTAELPSYAGLFSTHLLASGIIKGRAGSTGAPHLPVGVRTTHLISRSSYCSRCTAPPPEREAQVQLEEKLHLQKPFRAGSSQDIQSGIFFQSGIFAGHSEKDLLRTFTVGSSQDMLMMKSI